MFDLAAILPHSPLLLQNSHQQSELLKAFEVIRNNISDLGIQQIISVSSHPKFSRNGFSAYVHPALRMEFADFGDLATQEHLPMSWKLYQQLREMQSSTPIEPIDDEKLDYGHAIPLYQLFRDIPESKRPALLALNDFPEASALQQQQLGKVLHTLAESNPRTAIICTGDLAIASTPPMSTVQHQGNKHFIESFLNLELPASANQEANEQMSPACIVPTASIFFSAIESCKLSQSWSFETDQTDFFAALYLPA